MESRTSLETVIEDKKYHLASLPPDLDWSKGWVVAPQDKQFIIHYTDMQGHPRSETYRPSLLGDGAYILFHDSTQKKELVEAHAVL